MMPSLLVSIDVRARAGRPRARDAPRAWPHRRPRIPRGSGDFRRNCSPWCSSRRPSPAHPGGRRRAKCAAGRHRPARAALRLPSHPRSRSRCPPRPAGRRCRRRNAGSSSAGLEVVTHAFVDGDHGELAALDGDHAVHRRGRGGDRAARRRGTRRRGACCRRPARSPACRDSRASTRRNLTPGRERVVRNPKRIGSGSRRDSCFAQPHGRLAGEGHIRLVDTGFLAGADCGDPTHRRSARVSAA